MIQTGPVFNSISHLCHQTLLPAESLICSTSVTWVLFHVTLNKNLKKCYRIFPRLKTTSFCKDSGCIIREGFFKTNWRLSYEKSQRPMLCLVFCHRRHQWCNSSESWWCLPDQLISVRFAHHRSSVLFLLQVPAAFPVSSSFLYVTTGDLSLTPWSRWFSITPRVGGNLGKSNTQTLFVLNWFTVAQQMRKRRLKWGGSTTQSHVHVYIHKVEDVCMCTDA